MSSIRDLLANSWLGTLLGIDYSVANLYVGAITTSGAEVSGLGYARVNVSELLDAPSEGELKNSEPIIFPTALGPWGTINRLGLFSQASGGSMLFEGIPTSSVQILNGQTLFVDTGNFVVKFRDGVISFNIQGPPDPRAPAVNSPTSTFMAVPVFNQAAINFIDIDAVEAPFGTVISPPT